MYASFGSQTLGRFKERWKCNTVVITWALVLTWTVCPQSLGLRSSNFEHTYQAKHSGPCYNYYMYVCVCMCRTAEVQDKIRSVQDDLQRISTCIEEHESERSTKYRELRRKEQIFKGMIYCMSNLHK